MEKTFAAVPLSAVGQPCLTDGCEFPAAYKTRSQPTWCTDCIDAILAEGGLAAVEPFEGPRAWRLTRCLDCGVEAHYRLVYSLEKNAVGEKTCRACYWKEWAKDARALAGETSFRRVYSYEERPLPGHGASGSWHWVPPVHPGGRITSPDIFNTEPGPRLGGYFRGRKSKDVHCRISDHYCLWCKFLVL